MESIDIFIPSYKRAKNNKTAKYFIKIGYDPKKIHVILDSEADDFKEYEEVCAKMGVNLHVFDMEEARNTYDFIHRPQKTKRTVGIARNMFQDIAKKNNIEFFVVIDDDTNGFEIRPFGVYHCIAKLDLINSVFLAIKEFMVKRQIGCFGISQTGDMFARTNKNLIRRKIMNTTFYLMPLMYKGEKGFLDEDTCMFSNMMNEGYFAVSLASGLVLKQTSSALAKGGLTELYRESKLLVKSLNTPIMFPSSCIAEKQKRNGNRLHHKINYRYLMPCIIKGKRNNIAWNTYPEDIPFSSEPLNRKM